MRNWKRWGALLLILAMTATLLPLSALAAPLEPTFAPDLMIEDAPLPAIPAGEELALPADPAGAEDGIAVTVDDGDITLIAAKVSWAAVPDASTYTVAVTSGTHTGLGADNVWYQDNTARTAKLANLHPGTTYTVTVTGGGATGSATFTTKTATNTKAEAAKQDPEAPAPYGALPDDQQLYYHENDMAAFIHFGPNTFNNREWGTGNESPSDFNLAPGPLTDDPFYEDRATGQVPVYVDQWVKELQDAGFRRLIMVAKHHEGFCLWDSAYTDHDVMASPYGRDLLADVSSACTKYNMDMGFYFSPWDMHDPSYGQGAAYNEYYMNQLREVLGNKKYGNNGVFVETWMDGAKGSNVTQEYDFDEWFKLIRALQPKCLIYTDRADGGVRWSGNEVGSTGSNPEGTDAGDMCWQTMNLGTFNYEGVNTPGMMDPWKPGDNITKWFRQRGAENGVIWSVCECDVSIENGWFGKDGNSLRELDALIDMYLTSVGYGSPFLLNVPPVKSGAFRSTTSARLAELGKAIRDTFRTDMLQEANYTVTATADKTRTSEAAGKFGAANLIDGDPDTYWTMNDGETTGSVTISLGATRSFDVVTLKEYIPLGQRIKAGKVEYHDDTGWHDFGTFTTIGAKRIIRTYPVKGDQIKVTISGSNAVPLLSAVEVYKARSGMELGDDLPDGLTYIDDQAEGEIEYSATGWTKRTGDDYIGRTNTYANGAAASFQYTFNGSKIYVMGIKDTGNGKFRVKIDNGAWTEVNTANTTRRVLKTVLWGSDNLPEGAHTISVEWVSGWFDFDGLYILPAGKSIVEFEGDTYNAFPNKELKLKIVRSGSTANAVTFKVNDLPGTAVQGQHYEPVTAQVTIPAGETEKVVTVNVLNGTAGNQSIGKEFAMGIFEPGENVIVGFRKEAAINIVDPESIPQTPEAGATYTAEDPFQLPTKKGVTRRLEAEHMVLDGSGAAVNKEIRIQTDANASGGKKLGWFEPSNKATLYYNATQVGIYTMTLRYQSGRSEGNENKVNWQGEGVVSRSEKIPGLGGDGSAYGEHSYQFVVTQTGPGAVEFYADASASPNIDYFDFRLEATGPLAQSLSIDPATKELYLSSGDEDTAVLRAVLNPSNAANPVTWTSSDPAVVSVQPSGAINAHKNGLATITATVGEASYQHTATATVTVKTKLSGSVTLSSPKTDSQGRSLAQYGVPLTAEVNQVLPEAARATLAYQWKVDGAAVSGATGKTFTPQNPADIGKPVSVTVRGVGNYVGTIDSGALTLDKADGPALAAQPNRSDCTTSDNNDGKITGLFKGRAYEYQHWPKGGTTPALTEAWTAWTWPAGTEEEVPTPGQVYGSGEITGLTPGNYRLRRAATATHTAGEPSRTFTILSVEESTLARNINIPAMEGGRVTASSRRAVEGVRITLTAHPEESHTFNDDLAVRKTADGAAVELTKNSDGTSTFTMPGEDVEVSASFAIKTFQVTHDLDHVKCNMAGEHTHTVNYGDKPQIVLTPDPGYELPESITITQDNGVEFNAFTYRNGTIVFDQPVTFNMTVTGKGVMPLKGAVIVGKAQVGNTLTAKTLPANAQADYQWYLVDEGVETPIAGAETAQYAIAADDAGKTIVVKVTGKDGFSRKVTSAPTVSVRRADEAFCEVETVAVEATARVLVGKTLALTAAVTPEEATNPVLLWSSSNEAVATVDQAGVVTGVAEGSATITAAATDASGLAANCAVTVTRTNPRPPASGPSTPSETTETEAREDGAKVTTVTKPDGSKAQTVEQSNGTKSELAVTKDGAVTITVTTQDGEELAKVQLPAVVPAPAVSFQDLDKAPWAAEAVNKVAGLELVKGTGENRFSPLDPMTRGSLATLLYRLSNGKTGSAAAFQDVKAGKFYAKGVAWAAKAGVVTGISAELFAPEVTITREQLAVMLARYAKLVGLYTGADPEALAAFADGDATGSWAVDGVAWCVERGILQGKGQNSLDPTSSVTRGEVAVMLERFIDLLG